jgi:hypothetical protein
MSAAFTDGRLARLWRALCWQVSIHWFGEAFARARAGYPLPPPPRDALRDEILAMVFADEEDDDEPPPA